MARKSWHRETQGEAERNNELLDRVITGYHEGRIARYRMENVLLWYENRKHSAYAQKMFIRRCSQILKTGA